VKVDIPRAAGPEQLSAAEPLPRPRVLLLAYLISPVRGSESSVAWNFVTEMSAHCDLTVLFGAAGPHMGDFEEIETFVAQHRLPHVQFVPVAPSSLARLLNAANRRGKLVYTFYLAYRLWHCEVYRTARQLMQQQAFDLVHYLGPIGYREPGYLWQLDLPYVWGPIGGAPNVSAHLVPALPLAGKAKLLFRAAVNWYQLRFSLRVRRALSRADVLMTATTENQQIFERVLHRPSLYLPENGIVGPLTLDRTKFADLDRLQLIWIGSIEARKALKLLVAALGRCRHAERFTVNVVGDGPLRASLQREAQALGVSASFVWHSQVPRDRVRQLLMGSHLHVVTSVSEGNPTTIWEAMACGVPTMSLDHCGMRDTVLPEAGIKIPVTNVEGIIERMAAELDGLAAQPAQLEAMAEQVLVDAPRFHWARRPAFFLARYAEALRRHGNSALADRLSPPKVARP
jgi:glycosyltransferase involved in cell wall biosynthesis